MSNHIEGCIRSISSHRLNQYSKAGIPRLVAYLNDGSMVIGDMVKPEHSAIIGETFRFYGGWKEFKEDKSNHKYGDSNGRSNKFFAFDHYALTVESSPRGMAHYLSRHIEGIGPGRAKTIVAHFGAETIKTLREEPERAKEVGGISDDIVDRIAEHFSQESFDPEAYARLFDLLDGFQKPKDLIIRLLKDWGSSAPTKITGRPYLLLDYKGMGWKTVDEFALNRVKFDKRGLDRQCGAVLEILKKRAEQGHTTSLVRDVDMLSHGLIGMRPEAATWARMVHEDGDVALSDCANRSEESGEAEGLDFDSSDIPNTYDASGTSIASIASETEILPTSWVALPKYDRTERYIAKRIFELMKHGQPFPEGMEITGLKGEQIEAGWMILDYPFSILAGAPGSGKTFTVGRVIRACHDVGIRAIRVVAPTGRAAKRASELIADAMGGQASGVHPSTIHRALGFGPNTEDEDTPGESARGNRGRSSSGFLHNEQNPMNGFLFIISEQGMVGTRLFASLLAAIPLGARVLLEGDPHQIPSIDAGSCLRDMIFSKLIPTSILTEIRRSDGGGSIVKACHAMIAGRTPRPVTKFDKQGGNWMHWEVDDDNIDDAICSLNEQERDRGRYNMLRDTQTISPQKKIKGFGIHDLNERLSKILNPLPTINIGDSDEIRFRIGDKVIRKKNGTVTRLATQDEVQVEDEDYEEFDKAVSLIQGADTGDSSDFYAERGGNSENYFYWRDEEYIPFPTYVVNGDMGQVEDVVSTTKGDYVIVRFWNPDRLCKLSLGECHLRQGFCLSVHEYQGSGVPYLIIPFSKKFFWDRESNTGLWCRELVYTMISRAESRMKSLGQLDALSLAIGRQTLHQRKTRLVERLQEVFREREEFADFPEDSDFPDDSDDSGNPDDIEINGRCEDSSDLVSVATQYGGGDSGSHNDTIHEDWEDI